MDDMAGTRIFLACAVALGLAVTAGCTTEPPSGAASTAPPTTSTTSSPGAASGQPTTESTVPPTVTGSATYFTPTDPSSYTLTGRIAVEQARQDPFSNLLLRGALHRQPVTLDVVGTPDYPVTPSAGVTILLGTCRCDARGSGLRLTLPDASALRVEPNGDIAIRGTYQPVRTASDAVRLDPA